MGMPTKEQVSHALAVAAQMREQGEDPDDLAKCLLNFNYQLEHLNKVMQAAVQLCRSGMAVPQQSALRRAVDGAHDKITRSSGDRQENWTLS